MYKITNIVTGMNYVGSTTRNLDTRWTEHKRLLRKGMHHSWLLQAAWNEYGEAAFVFEVIERCEPAYAEMAEQFWKDKLQSYDRRYGYDVCSKAGTVFGFKRGPMSDAHKEKAAFSKRIPVTATHLKTGEVLHFASIVAAKRAGFIEQLISQVVRGKRRHHRGYIWLMSGSAPPSIDDIKMASANPHNKPLIATNMKTGEVLCFESSVAAGEYGFHQAAAADDAAGKRISHAGYIWTYANAGAPTAEEIENAKCRRKRGLPVKAIHLKTGETLYFESAHAAGLAGFNQGWVSSCVRGEAPHHKGYVWSLADADDAAKRARKQAQAAITQPKLGLPLPE